MATLPPEILEDDMAISLAKVLAAANKQARQLGVEAEQSSVTISQKIENGYFLWRINYGPKNFVGRRGGDLIIDVDPSDASIKKVLFGQ